MSLLRGSLVIIGRSVHEHIVRHRTWQLIFLGAPHRPVHEAHNQMSTEKSVLEDIKEKERGVKNQNQWPNCEDVFFRDSMTTRRKHRLSPWLPTFELTGAKGQGRQRGRRRQGLKVVNSTTPVVSAEACPTEDELIFAGRGGFSHGNYEGKSSPLHFSNTILA